MTAALGHHPLILVVGAWLLGWAVVAVWRRRGPGTGWGRSLKYPLAATAILFMVTWVVRLTAGTLPPV